MACHQRANKGGRAAGAEGGDTCSSCGAAFVKEDDDNVRDAGEEDDAASWMVVDVDAIFVFGLGEGNCSWAICSAPNFIPAGKIKAS